LLVTYGFWIEHNQQHPSRLSRLLGKLTTTEEIRNNMQQQLIVVRHGQTAYNLAGLIQGHIDIPLNSRGKIQAEQLGLILREHHFDHVFSSDLSRSTLTAELILKENKHYPRVPVTQLDKRLREYYFGEYDGQLWHHQAFNSTEANLSIESKDAFRKRVWNFLDELYSRFTLPQSILVISHLGLLQLLLEEASVQENYRGDNCSALLFTLGQNRKIHFHTSLHDR